jgi:hypothetical protein
LLPAPGRSVTSWKAFNEATRNVEEIYPTGRKEELWTYSTISRPVTWFQRLRINVYCLFRHSRSDS